MFIRHFLVFVFLALILIGCGKPTQATYIASDTTNKEWVNGVARDWATGFFVKNTPEAARDFAVGKKIILADGSIRAITNSRVNGGDLIVFLEGGHLDGKLVGYPKPIKPYAQSK